VIYISQVNHRDLPLWFLLFYIENYAAGKKPAAFVEKEPGTP